MVREARRVGRRRCRWRARATSQRALERPAGAASRPARAAPPEPAARRRYGTRSAAPRWRSGVAAPGPAQQQCFPAHPLYSAHADGGHPVPHLLERAFPQQPRPTGPLQGSASRNVRVGARAPGSVGLCLSGGEPARVAGAGPAPMAVHIVHTLLYAVHPKQPDQSGRRQAAGAERPTAATAAPPCVRVADSRA